VTPSTVWLASYLKSGNTWVRALLAALLGAGEPDINQLGHGPIASGRGHFEYYTGIISSDLTNAEIASLRPSVERAFDRELTETRYRKIHDALFSGADRAPIIAPDATLGAVYIVRDPRDVAVSLAHHAGHSVARTTERMAAPTSTFEETTHGITPQVPTQVGNWSDHARGWVEQQLFPVLVVRYEDLHADPAHQLMRIARFGNIEPTGDAITAAVRAARFDRLREREEHEGFNERSGAGRTFFRRGIAGGWRDELPAGLAEQIVRDHGEMMRWFGYLGGDRGRDPRCDGAILAYGRPADELS
jgi:hypothetical protein